MSFSTKILEHLLKTSLLRTYVNGGIIVGNVVTVTNIAQGPHDAIWRGVTAGTFWPAYIAGKTIGLDIYNEMNK